MHEVIRYLGLCVSTRVEDWPLRPMPFYCHVDKTRFPRDKNRDRIEFLASKWNEAHTIGLERFPDTTHIINVGSYYLPQVEALSALIVRYESTDGNCILAGNVWAKLEDYLTPYYTTYDTWATPDLKGLSYRFRKPKQLVQLSSVGMPCIYPVKAWSDHPFHNPENMMDGIWYNQFCKEAGLPVMADLSIRFYRTSTDSDIRKHSLQRRILHEFHHDLVVGKSWIKKGGASTL